jgi:polyisoprenoid-binding protein YceI
MQKIGRIIAICVVLFPTLLAAQDTGTHWQIMPEKSMIEWTAKYGGQDIKGNFPDYKADIIFDVLKLATSKATIRIETGKVKSTDKDAESSLPGKEWFASAEYPVAVLESNSFKHIKDDQYEMDATLSLHGKQVKIELPFTAKFYDEKAIHYARIDGVVIVKRLDFAIGQGEWVKTDSVANEVRVAIHLQARQVP